MAATGAAHKNDRGQKPGMETWTRLTEPRQGGKAAHHDTLGQVWGCLFNALPRLPAARLICQPGPLSGAVANGAKPPARANAGTGPKPAG